MNPDIRVSHAALDLNLATARYRDGELRMDGVHLRWRRTHERDRHGVLSRIAALQMSHSVVGIARWRVVRMSREPMMVLRMVVILVGVRVQQRRHAERRNQRRDEQQRCNAVHKLSL